jgi:ABC-type glycerol-3-phosphate transport system substrate-binding protein
MKSRTTRSTAIGATLLATALGVTACSSSAGTDASASADQVELVIWDTNLLAKINNDGSADASGSFLHQASGLYTEQHPEVTFKIVYQGTNASDNQAQFQAASIAGNGPDIRVQNNGGPLLSFEDYYVDLRDVLDEGVFDDMTGWEAVRADYSEDGAVLGLPYGSGSYFVVWYNKQLLRDAGIDPDAIPATWEDMLDTGQEYLDATGDAPFQVANLEGYVGAWVIPTLAAGELGGSAFTDQYSGKTAIDSPEMVEAYQLWSDFYASGLTNKDAGELAEVDNTPGFVSGDTPYYFAGTWMNVTLQEAFGDEVGYFFIPTLEGSTYEKVAAGGPNIAVSMTNYGKHQEEAADFINFLAQPEIQDLYVKLTQVEGSNSKSADTSVITNDLLKQQAQQLQEMDAVVFPFDSVMPQAVIDLYYRVNTTAFLGTQTPEDAVAQLQKTFEQEK